MSDADSEVVIGSLGVTFGGGVWRRLTGSYPRCGNRRALQIMRGRLAETSGKQRQSVEQVVTLLERKAAALQRVRGYVSAAPCSKSGSTCIPLTFVLIAALLAHVVSVFFYW